MWVVRNWLTGEILFRDSRRSECDKWKNKPHIHSGVLEVVSENELVAN